MPNGWGSVYPFSEFLGPAAISGFWGFWGFYGFKGFRVLKALKVFRKKYLLFTLY